MMKTCTKCEKTKPLEDFNKRKSAKDGLRSDCKECQKEYHKQNYKKNKQQILERNKEWLEKNPWYLEKRKGRVREYNRRYVRERHRTDPDFALRRNISRGLHRALARDGTSKAGRSTFEILPYSVKQLKEHLQAQFDEQMSWENHGTYWHIDHVVPMSFFDHTKDQHIEWCWSLENLRPLEAVKNMSKSDQIVLEEVRSLSFFNEIKDILDKKINT